MLLLQLVEFLPARVQPFAKALVAGVVGAVAPFVVAGLTTGQWDKAAIIGGIAGVLLGGGVAAVPNIKREEGFVSLPTLVYVLVAILCVLLILALLGVDLGLDVDTR